MTPQDFIAKWTQVELTERSAAQQHFLDLCEVFDHPKPAAADPTGESFTFEKGATKHGGGDGYLQWMHHNGFKAPTDPVLESIESIKLMDAILALSDPKNPKEPEWPKAEFIVGNPPFLGNRLMSAYFDPGYIEALSKVYEQRMGGRPDICCYCLKRHAI